MSWIIKCWTTIKDEESKIYLSQDELDRTIENLRLMCPENKYVDMGYRIKCYAPGNIENPVKYPTKDDAQKDIDDHFEILQPENIYEAVEISCENEKGHYVDSDNKSD